MLRRPTAPNIDFFLGQADRILKALTTTPAAGRPSPAHHPHVQQRTQTLSDEDKRTAGRLMRVNHVGEVCAQALYQAQALTTRNDVLRRSFDYAAQEENDHLAWTAERLTALGARPSLLNPLWFAGAFGLGLLAGRLGDSISLGFMAETERQVEQHLAGHLQHLPAADIESRAIVEQMQSDEAQHGQTAVDLGGIDLPQPVKWLMRGMAKIMTSTASVV